MPAQRKSAFLVTARNYLTAPAGQHPCGNNLYLFVEESGSRRWLFRYSRNGQVGRMGLGSARDVTLNEARDKAIDARRLLAQGKDPKAERDEQRRAEQGSPLFGDYAAAWADTYAKSLNHDRARAKLKRNIEVHCAALHRFPVADVTTDQVINLVLRPLLDARQGESARDVRQRLGLIFKAAIADGYRLDNPADYETRLRPKLGKAPKRGRARGHNKGVAHHALPAFMATIAGCPDASMRALELLVLTVARTAEVRHMRWSQLDLDAGLWTITGADTSVAQQGGEGTKNGLDKITPLSHQAVALLRAHEATYGRVSDYVFCGRNLAEPMYEGTMLARLKSLSGDDTLTAHGLRGTFRTWAQEDTDFDRETVEHCMHHILGDAAELAYKHGKALAKRRAVLQAWADFATRPAAKVVALKSVA